MKQQIITKHAPQASGPYSQGVKVNDFIFVSGQDGIYPSGELAGETLEEQTKACLNNIKSILQEAGASVDDIMHMNCHLHDLTEENVREFNKVYEVYFENVEVKPTRITVGSQLLGTDVEISAIASIS